MIVSRPLLEAALAGPHPAELNDAASLDVRFAGFLLHLGTVCPAGERLGDVAHLLATVPSNQPLGVCDRCLVGGQADPVRTRGSWLTELYALLIADNLEETVAKLLRPLRADVDDIADAAADLVSNAGVYTYDTAADYFGDPARKIVWQHPHLEDMSHRSWEAGAESFEQALAKRSGASLLIGLDPPDPNTWAVVGKGLAYWSQRYSSTRGYRPTCSAAVLEGPRITQTADWFIAPVTWNSSERKPQHATITARPDLSASTLQAALSLWDGVEPKTLERLIDSVSDATST
jgi:hypothetical protein